MTYDSLKEFTGKPIIAWLSYNENYIPNSPDENNTVVFVSPRFIKEDEEWELLSTSSFPNRGSIATHLIDRKEASEFIEETGHLAIVRINDNNYPDDAYLYPNKEKPTWYHLGYNPRKKKSGSQIWIEHFTETQNFYQIIEAGSSFEDIRKNKKIPLQKDVYTKEVFVKSGSFFYGPFRYEKQNDQTLALFSKEDNDNLVNKYSFDDISDFKMDIQDENNNVVVSLIDREKFYFIKEKYHEKIDWLTDEELVKYLVDITKTCGYTKEQCSEISKLLSSHDFISLEERRERLLEMLGRAVQKYDFVQSLCSVIMNNDELKSIFVQNLPDDLDILANNNHYKSKVSELEKLKEELEKLKDDLNKSQVRENIVTPSDNDLYAENERLEKENENLKQKIGSIEEFEKRKEQLNNEITQLDAHNEYLKEKQKTIKNQIKETIDNLDATIIANQIDTKLLDDVLKVISGKEMEDAVVPQKFDADLLLNYTPDELIDRIKDASQSCGREIKTNDVVNILTCISNGFITTFAGEPGAGKTSLCNFLAKTLGLARADGNNRFIEVSVERGWTSLKDFIGYYNPLTKTIEKSNINIFNAIEANALETDPEKRAPLWILLDEANLSPIEHYWANFLRLCDEDSVGFKGINLGGGKQFSIQSNLRFLATVNFDHTTEELSPRFLDRSWIIWLEPNNTSIEHFFSPDPDMYVISDASFSELKNKTNGKNSEDILTFNEEKWRNVQALFRDYGYQIMPRNQKMVQAYLATASLYMDVDREQYAPLDYAVAQKILPLINGSGENYKRLLNTLLEKCGNLPLCQMHLKRIINFADKNMGYYQFFAR